MAAKGSDSRVNNLIWGVLLSLAGIGLLLFNLDVFVRFEPYVQYGGAALLACWRCYLWAAIFLPATVGGA